MDLWCWKKHFFLNFFPIEHKLIWFIGMMRFIPVFFIPKTTFVFFSSHSNATVSCKKYEVRSSCSATLFITKQLFTYSGSVLSGFSLLKFNQFSDLRICAQSWRMVNVILNIILIKWLVFLGRFFLAFGYDREPHCSCVYADTVRWSNKIGFTASKKTHNISGLRTFNSKWIE